MQVPPLCGDHYGSRLGRIPGRIGQEVAQHLEGALAVGHHQGKPSGQVDENVVSAPAADEGAPRLVNKVGDVRRCWLHRQCARLDAGHGQQVAFQHAYAVGLLHNDPEELAHLGRVQGRPRRPGEWWPSP